MTVCGTRAGKAITILVKLNLQNEEVVQYLLESVRGWVDEFDIDGRGWMSLIVWTKISSAV